MATRKTRLEVVEKPAKDASIIEPVMPGLLVSQDDEDLLCGNCGAVLGRNISLETVRKVFVAPAQLLIKCPECDREVSDKATACPHCGCPLVEVSGRPVATARTKELRTMYAIAIVTAFVGAVIWIGLSFLAWRKDQRPPDAAIVGGGLLAMGVALMIVGKFRLWRHHEQPPSTTHDESDQDGGGDKAGDA